MSVPQPFPRPMWPEKTRRRELKIVAIFMRYW